MNTTDNKIDSMNTQETYDTLVVGGGYAGLSAMQTLIGNRVKALLCEARNREGGRTIVSRKGKEFDTASSPAITQRGAFFVYTHEMKERLEQVGVDVCELSDNDYYVVTADKKIVPAGPDGGPWGLARTIANEILTNKQNVSYAKFFETSKTFNAMSIPEQKAVSAIFEADLAGPLDEVGISSAFHDGQTTGAKQEFFGICTTGGLSTLATSMAKNIPQESKKTGTKIQSIHINEENGLTFGFEHEFSDNSGVKINEVQSKSGIITAPLAAIDKMTFIDRDGTKKPLRDAMRPDVQKTLNMLGNGSVVKIGLKIKKPLVAGKKIVNMVIAPPDKGPIRCASIRALPMSRDKGENPSEEKNMLLLYLGGSQARDFTKFCNDLEIGSGENKLNKIKKEVVLYLQEHVAIDPDIITDDAIDISGWSPEKGDRTAYSYIKADDGPTSYNPRSVFRESVLPEGMPPLYLAGEAYSEAGATLTTGAYDSGKLAAERIEKDMHTTAGNDKTADQLVTITKGTTVFGKEFERLHYPTALQLAIIIRDASCDLHRKKVAAKKLLETGDARPQDLLAITDNNLMKPEEINAVLEDGEERKQLLQAMKEDREGLHTKVEMIAVAPGDETNFRKWIDKYMTIFTDPNDMESEKTIRKWWKEDQAILYMIQAKMNKKGEKQITKDIGMNLTMINDKVPHAAYVPYVGIDEKFRGVGGYSRAVQHCEADLERRGVEVIVIDCEDAERIERFRESYSGLSDKEIIDLCNNRLHFWMLNNYVFVHDQHAKYRRPSSDNPKEIQAYDLLGIRTIANAKKYDQYFRKDANGKRTHITKEGYREMYLLLHAIDQRNKGDEVSLRNDFPAIDSFLTELDSSPNQEFTLFKDCMNISDESHNKP